MNLILFMLLSGLIILCHRDPWLGCREKETNWPVVCALSHLALYSSSTDQYRLTLLIHSLIYLIHIHISVTTMGGTVLGAGDAKVNRTGYRLEELLGKYGGWHTKQQL